MNDLCWIWFLQNGKKLNKKMQTFFWSFSGRNYLFLILRFYSCMLFFVKEISQLKWIHRIPLNTIYSAKIDSEATTFSIRTLNRILSVFTVGNAHECQFNLCTCFNALLTNHVGLFLQYFYFEFAEFNRLFQRETDIMIESDIDQNFFCVGNFGCHVETSADVHLSFETVAHVIDDRLNDIFQLNEFHDLGIDFAQIFFVFFQIFTEIVVDERFEFFFHRLRTWRRHFCLWKEMFYLTIEWNKLMCFYRFLTYCKKINLDNFKLIRKKQKLVKYFDNCAMCKTKMTVRRDVKWGQSDAIGAPASGSGKKCNQRYCAVNVRIFHRCVRAWLWKHISSSWCENGQVRLFWYDVFCTEGCAALLFLLKSVIIISKMWFCSVTNTCLNLSESAMSCLCWILITFELKHYAEKSLSSEQSKPFKCSK